MRLVIIFDNCQAEEGCPDCQTAWGFSCFFPERKFLFDTGSSGPILLHNMASLGISPRDIDQILLSHFHWDHTGGLFDLLAKSPDKILYLHTAFSQRFAEEAVRFGAQVRWQDDPAELAPGVFTTGKIDGPVAEAGLVIQSENGLALITGCAHPDILHMSQEVARFFGRPPFLVLGGFHLLNASRKKILALAEGLEALGVRFIAPSHCTGDKAIGLLADLYEESFIPIGVGKVLEL